MMFLEAVKVTSTFLKGGCHLNSLSTANARGGQIAPAAAQPSLIVCRPLLLRRLLETLQVGYQIAELVISQTRLQAVGHDALFAGDAAIDVALANHDLVGR